jgi:hypothetical protein
MILVAWAVQQAAQQAANAALFRPRIRLKFSIPSIFSATGDDVRADLRLPRPQKQDLGHPNSCVTIRKYPITGLEEEPQPGLHHPLAGLAVDAAKVGVVRICDDVAEDRMVEDVLRLEAQLEVARLVVTEVELLEDAGIRLEAAWIAQTREEQRRVGHRIIRGPRKCRGIQHTRTILVCPRAVDHQSVFVAHA